MQTATVNSQSRKSLVIIAALVLLISLLVIIIASQSNRPNNGNDNNNTPTAPAAVPPAPKPGFSKVVISQTNLSTKVKEGGATDDISLSLQSQPTAEVVISVDVNKQITATPAKLIFTKDNWNKPQKLVLKAVDDNIDEDDLHYQTVSFSVSSRDENYNNIVATGVKVEIADKN